MPNRLVITSLRVLLLAAAAVILLLQAVVLPWLSAQVARELPDEAFMRWPILILAILGLACVQVAILCTCRLLRMVREDRVFTLGASVWVNAIIAAFVGGALVCAATLVYQSVTVAGPFLWMVALWIGVFAGTGLAMLMWTMRALLVQATQLRSDMEMVI